MAAQAQTMVRVYKSNDAYRRDAERLTREGWTAISVTERRPRAGCARLLLLWFVVLIFPPKPELVVTYQRTTETATKGKRADGPGTCPNCGTTVSGTTWYCPKCGAQLRT